MEHALPHRTAGTPRTWSLCMTSENHGTVGPAGCKFSHAPDKHERVLVVEVPSPADAPSDQVNLRLITAPVAAQASQVAAPAEQIEWSHDLQERLIAAGQEFDEHENVRQVMAEAACLLAALTGVRAPASGERRESGSRG
jgi:hypothetical protein